MPVKDARDDYIICLPLVIGFRPNCYNGKISRLPLPVRSHEASVFSDVSDINKITIKLTHG